jgi:hypothetical protein
VDSTRIHFLVIPSQVLARRRAPGKS